MLPEPLESSKEAISFHDIEHGTGDRGRTAIRDRPKGVSRWVITGEDAKPQAILFFDRPDDSVGQFLSEKAFRCLTRSLDEGPERFEA